MSNPASTTGSFTYDKIAWALMTLEHEGGAECFAKAPARFDEGTRKVVTQLGDVAGLFDDKGTPNPARCNER